MYNERRERIRALLTEKPFISIKELQSMFPDVSGMTLRRDIEFFESQGEAIKVRGGARSMKFITTSTDDAITTRMQENVASKEKIARRAAEFLDKPVQILLKPGKIFLHQWQDGGIKPIVLTVWQLTFCCFQESCKMAHTKTFSIFNKHTEFRLFDQVEKGRKIPTHTFFYAFAQKAAFFPCLLPLKNGVLTCGFATKEAFLRRRRKGLDQLI